MKLLTQISIRYIILAAIIFLLAIPTFYYALQRVMLHNLDEYLVHQKEQIKAELKVRPVSSFTSFNGSIIIADTNAPSIPQRFYNKDVWAVSDSETITHRAIESIEKVNGKSYYIYIQKSLIENEDLTQSIVLLLAVLLLFLFAGSFLINRWASKKLWKPFNDTLQKLTAFQINQSQSLQLPSTSTSEFNQLNHSLEQLTTNAQTLFSAQKEFTENASHELQTPIAIIQGKTELLMQTNPLTNEQATLINDVYSAGQRMAKLNRNLLMLTKIENNQYPLTDYFSLETAVNELLVVFEDLATERNITFQKSFSENINLRANKTLFDVMVGNLIKNALLHSPAASTIHFSFQNNEMTICNPALNGPLDTKFLFRRFQKQNSRESGTGLGLHLSQKIASLFGLNLAYIYENTHHCFILNFTDATTQ